jgi:hypothetical protein
VEVSIAWLKDRPEAYQTLCKIWDSEEFISRSTRARECRGTGGSGHMYDPDGHIRMGQRMVRKIITKIHSHFVFFVTNSYPQEHAGGQQPPDMNVWKRGHRGSDPSNPDKLCTPVAEARLVSY